MVTVFEPEALFRHGQLRFGETLAVDAQGTIVAHAPSDATRVRLPGKVLLPGLVNGHSHAFQRVLRARTEVMSASASGDDFWSWREAMYAAATSLDPEGVFVVSRQAFLEMALAGITTVGEFHYLHHQPDGTPYVDEHELALQVLRAANEVGLRIALLRVAYARAGFGVAPNPRQRRFLDPDVETCLRRTSELKARVEGPLVTVGLAPHSVRAVPRSWLEAMHAWRGPLHAHVSEQPAEIAASLKEHGRRPVQLFDDLGLLGPRFTGVHAIHLDAEEVQRLGATGSTVCACPSTERNLGDGVVRADELLSAGVTVSLGTDSQAHVDLLDDARQLEGHLRLLRLRRNVLTPATGDRSGLAARLLECATVSGARSLGVKTGLLEPGHPADFVTLRRDGPALAGLDDESLLSGVVLAGAPVADVAVAGRFIVRDGVHALAQTATLAFRSVMKTLVA
jgi:formimidoylglutamate deiminase